MIECRDLVKVYEMGDFDTTALKGVSFTIEKGEFVAIIGPSGSGKSTLMHILGALDTPTSGQYFLNGKEVSTMDDDELSDLRRNEIGFVFQSFNNSSQRTKYPIQSSRFLDEYLSEVAVDAPVATFIGSSQGW